jgi:hypothetical protein
MREALKTSWLQFFRPFSRSDFPCSVQRLRARLSISKAMFLQVVTNCKNSVKMKDFKKGLRPMADDFDMPSVVLY